MVIVFNMAHLFQNEVTFKLRIADSRKVMNGCVKDLQLYSCCFNPKKRKETMAQVCF